MSRLSLIAVILILAAAPGFGAELAPDWRLATGDGSSIRLSQEVKQQPVVLLFWATWCPYCKALMPHVQSIRLEYGDKVKILAIQIRDKKDAVAFIDDAGYDFTVLPHGDDVAELYGIYTTPGVILVDDERLMQFDLRALPNREVPAKGEEISHSRKAAYKAPYWAAELRKAIDAVLDDS
jgi:cytochrome c biogenesis protein CcmG/thiol:disulfide interchange protein DsbE